MGNKVFTIIALKTGTGDQIFDSGDETRINELAINPSQKIFKLD